MSCELEKKDGTSFAVLSFLRDELLYDIKNAAFIEGSVMEVETADHNRHMVQDVGEEGNVDRVTRILGLTVAQCREMLYPFTKHDLREAVKDDRLKEPEMYGIILKVPEDFSQTTLDLLEHLIHELLVCKAVAEWLRITHPAKSGSWAEKAEETAEEIRVNLNSRMKRSRIRPHWL